jgi:hypothetical protein
MRVFLSFSERLRLAPDATASAAKVCGKCGTDLTGKKRYKDKNGYLCPECEKADRKRRLPCAECGKPTAPELLRPFGTISICPGCFLDHERDPKTKVVKKISTKKHDFEEHKKLYILAGIAGVLLLILLLSQVGIL